jgi:arsenite methyltransferase
MGSDHHGAMLEFDQDTALKVEAVYTTPDVVAQRREVRATLAPQPGELVLDVGSGPGFLAAEIAHDVGPSGRVHGVDPSAAMLEIARRRTTAGDAAPLRFGPGAADALPLADETFDAVVCTQVLEYVDDVAGALAEMRRVLRPGGRLLALDTDWSTLRLRTGDPQRMARVLAAWEEHLVHPHLPRSLPALIEEAGLRLERSEVVPIVNRGFDPDTYGAGLIGLVAAFVPGRRGVTADDARAWADELRGLGAGFELSLERELFVAVR